LELLQLLLLPQVETRSAAWDPSWCLSLSGACTDASGHVHTCDGQEQVGFRPCPYPYPVWLASSCPWLTGTIGLGFKSRATEQTRTRTGEKKTIRRGNRRNDPTREQKKHLTGKTSPRHSKTCHPNPIGETGGRWGRLQGGM